MSRLIQRSTVLQYINFSKAITAKYRKCPTGRPGFICLCTVFYKVCNLSISASKEFLAASDGLEHLNPIDCDANANTTGDCQVF